MAQKWKSDEMIMALSEIEYGSTLSKIRSAVVTGAESAIKKGKELDQKALDALNAGTSAIVKGAKSAIEKGKELDQKALEALNAGTSAIVKGAKSAIKKGREMDERALDALREVKKLILPGLLTDLRKMSLFKYEKEEIKEADMGMSLSTVTMNQMPKRLLHMLLGPAAADQKCEFIKNLYGLFAKDLPDEIKMIKGIEKLNVVKPNPTYLDLARLLNEDLMESNPDYKGLKNIRDAASNIVQNRKNAVNAMVNNDVIFDIWKSGSLFENIPEFPEDLKKCSVRELSVQCLDRLLYAHNEGECVKNCRKIFEPLMNSKQVLPKPIIEVISKQPKLLHALYTKQSSLFKYSEKDIQSFANNPQSMPTAFFTMNLNAAFQILD